MIRLLQFYKFFIINAISIALRPILRLEWIAVKVLDAGKEGVDAELGRRMGARRKTSMPSERGPSLASARKPSA
jgi:hypothetical protein